MNITVFWDVVSCNILLCTPHGSSRFSDMFVNFLHTYSITSKKMVHITVFYDIHTINLSRKSSKQGIQNMKSVRSFPSGNICKQLTNCIFESYTKVRFGTLALRVCRLKLFQHVGIRSGYHIQGRCLAEWTC